MKRLLLLLSLGIVSLHSYGQEDSGRSLHYYIETAKKNSPLITDYRNQTEIEQAELGRLKAMYTHSRLELNLLCGIDDVTDVSLSDISQPVRLRSDAEPSLFTEQYQLDSLNAAVALRSFNLQYKPKLDLLLQQPELTERQTDIIQDLYQMNSRLSRLNRNLLLLAKMENNQFSRTESVDVITVIKELQPYLESLSGELVLKQNFSADSLPINANRSLLESMVNNLVVNAVRHNKSDGEITVSLSDNRLTVSNTSNEAALDENLIFNRFYRPLEKAEGNGLGLAIVKAVCDYHGWKISYAYTDGKHEFTVIFS